MPIHIPELVSVIRSEPDAELSADASAAGQLTDDLVRQVTERVMALLLEDLRHARERRRSVGRSDRLKGVR